MDKIDVHEIIKEDRLGALMDRLASFGARSDGGVNRQAYTREDLLAHRFLVDHARSLGATVLRDPIGNMFLRWAGRNDDLPPVVTGSHVDSQPNGGRYDGAAGVCAGIEVIAAMSSVGARTLRPIEVAIWTNEEGSRFAPGCMGSATYVAPSLLDQMLESTDSDGRTVREELVVLDELFADVPLRDFGGPMHAFVELHIEQGPLLEEAGLSVGIVNGVAATRWFSIESSGRSGHAGTTPRHLRSDAFRSLVHFLDGLYSEFDEGDDDLRLTVGKVSVVPGSVNVISDRAVASLDIRHPDDQVLDALVERIDGRVNDHRGQVVLNPVMQLKSMSFDEAVLDVLREAARESQASFAELNSGAFHDALYLAEHCPSAMLFVPSVGGLSHTPEERTDLSDIYAGARVLAAALHELAEQ